MKKGLLKNIHTNLLIIAILCLCSIVSSAQVRMAFLGNSITIGSGLQNAAQDCYPSQFANMLKQVEGANYEVMNFAVSGRTMLRKGDYPLWNETQFGQALNFKPDIVYIMLGTNDTKPQNWDQHGSDFETDYQAMIDTFKVINPNAKFILAYPPPAFKVRWGIRDSIITNGVNPVLSKLIEQNKAYSVDYYKPLVDKGSLFPDAIHPNADGAGEMAKILFSYFEDHLIEKQ